MDKNLVKTYENELDILLTFLENKEIFYLIISDIFFSKFFVLDGHFCCEIIL